MKPKLHWIVPLTRVPTSEADACGMPGENKFKFALIYGHTTTAMHDIEYTSLHLKLPAQVPGALIILVTRRL